MHTTEKADLLYGVPAIAAYLGMTAAQVYHLTKELPTFKIGAKVCARKSAIDDWLDAQARQAVEGSEDD